MTNVVILAFLLVSSTSAAELRPLHVALPRDARTLPEGSDQSGSTAAFEIRGMKGWGWLPSQYLAEIPVMAKYRMNFLMNCYSSLWDLGERGKWVASRKMNFWYKPLPELRKREFEEIVRSSKRHGIQFCFSLNPNLMSDRPFDYNSSDDLEALWSHYAWMQDLGVKWFNVSLDDIGERIEADGQARLLNEIFTRLRKRDPQAQLVFCPTWYAGTGEAPKESGQMLGAGDTPGQRYTRTLAEKLHPEIYLFWTGSDVCPLEISREDARKYRALVRHRVILWDNYPVNDQLAALHLGPLSGRDPALPEVLSGYVANALSFQNEANRIPMLTIADYLWNPHAYDSKRSIGQAILHLGETAEQRSAIRDLVELYPGRLWDHSTSTGWNSLRQRFSQAMKEGSRTEAQRLVDRAAATSDCLRKAFPGRFTATLELLNGDIVAMRQELSKATHPPGTAKLATRSR